jgi:hypothetical protein
MSDKLDDTESKLSGGIQELKDMIKILQCDLITTKKELDISRREAQVAQRQAEEDRKETQKAWETIKSELVAARSEIALLKSEISSISNNTLVRTYASAATSAINSPSSAGQKMQSTGGRDVNPAATQKQPLPGVTIDLRRTKEDINTMNLLTLKQTVQKVVQAQELTKHITIKGMQLRGSTIRVVVQNEEEAQAIRVNDGWVTKCFDGARVRGEEWFPVKVDDVHKASVFEDDGVVMKADIGIQFSIENSTGPIHKVTWLSRGPKPRGSMAVYFARAEDADRLLKTRICSLGGHISFTSEYRRIPRPIRCGNCCQLGHHEVRCTRETACGNCAGNHRTESCISPDRKCIVCGDTHAVTDPGCPEFRKEREKLMRAVETAERRNTPPISHDV